MSLVTMVLEKEGELENLWMWGQTLSDLLFILFCQVVYDGLFGANTNAKLRSLSLQFVHHICIM